MNSNAFPPDPLHIEITKNENAYSSGKILKQSFVVSFYFFGLKIQGDFRVKR